MQDSQAEHSSTVSRDHRTRPPRNRRPNLRQLNADDVDAVYAGSQGMVDSLRDVQVSLASQAMRCKNEHTVIIEIDVVVHHASYVGLITCPVMHRDFARPSTTRLLDRVGDSWLQA